MRAGSYVWLRARRMAMPDWSACGEQQYNERRAEEEEARADTTGRTPAGYMSADGR